MSRRSPLPVPSATTAVTALAIALIAGIALFNTARVGTTIPNGVYLPSPSAGAAPTPAGSGAGGPAGLALQGANRDPGASTVPPTLPPTGVTAARSTSPAPNTSETNRSSGSDAQVRTVAPNYPVDVSSDDQPTSDGTSSVSPSTTTASGASVDH